VPEGGDCDRHHILHRRGILGSDQIHPKSTDRLVEMNQQVLGNLDRIISALKDEDSAPEREMAADAS
jgi:hypothetical protein